MSVPNAIVAPALCERARASLIFTPTIIAFSICAGVNDAPAQAMGRFDDRADFALSVNCWSSPALMLASAAGMVTAGAVGGFLGRLLGNRNKS